jgi:hypothetical protein
MFKKNTAADDTVAFTEAERIRSWIEYRMWERAQERAAGLQPRTRRA